MSLLAQLTRQLSVDTDWQTNLTIVAPLLVLVASCASLLTSEAVVGDEKRALLARFRARSEGIQGCVGDKCIETGAT